MTFEEAEAMAHSSIFIISFLVFMGKPPEKHMDPKFPAIQL